MNKKILFVDDDLNVLKSYKRTYRKLYNIVTALSGEEGIKKLYESEEDFAIVISDMKMPEMNGLKFLAEVKKLFPKKLRIILSGNPDLLDVKEAEKNKDIFKYLKKPCNQDDFNDTIIKAFEIYSSSK